MWKNRLGDLSMIGGIGSFGQPSDPLAGYNYYTVSSTTRTSPLMDIPSIGLSIKPPDELVEIIKQKAMQNELEALKKRCDRLSRENEILRRRYKRTINKFVPPVLYKVIDKVFKNASSSQSNHKI
jgi:hypothetical protein